MPRPETPWEHLIRDYREGADGSRHEHYVEWAQLVEKCPQEALEQRVALLEEARGNIHFHVWTPTGFAQWLEACRKELGFSFTVEAIEPNAIEFIVLLRKLKL